MGDPAGVRRDFNDLEQRRMAAARLLRQGLSLSIILATLVRCVEKLIAHDLQVGRIDAGALVSLGNQAVEQDLVHEVFVVLDASRKRQPQ